MNFHCARLFRDVKGGKDFSIFNKDLLGLLGQFCKTRYEGQGHGRFRQVHTRSHCRHIQLHIVWKAGHVMSFCVLVESKLYGGLREGSAVIRLLGIETL